MLEPLRIDVALVPDEVDRKAGLLVMIDQIRASTTITTLLDLGCRHVYLARSVGEARRLARRTGSLLAGEHHAVRPKGFDFENSPSQLTLEAGRVRDRSVVLCTTNGTAVLHRVRRLPTVLIGCLRNARACAGVAVSIATSLADRDAARPQRKLQPAMQASPHIQVTCAGGERRFVLEDAVTAGVIAKRIVEIVRATGRETSVTDAADAAMRLYASEPDLLWAMTNSSGGRTLRAIGQADDIVFCACEDATATVPVLCTGPPMRADRFRAAGAAPAPSPDR